MTLTFLCPTHRDWMYFHPQEALLYIDNNQHQGEWFMQQNNWEQASAFLGCAFETTEILMELQGSERSFLVSRLTSLAVLLSESFNQLQTLNIGKQVLEQTVLKLQLAAQNSVSNEPRHAYIQQCIQDIKIYIEGYKLPAAYSNLSTQTH